ncbi:hypothetical protein OPU71_10065 [Niveibacterium sp. 24ML]|uniref:esterase/lipase family protein n=1 Tax=Niveibacterium sp. 24ML TaxID=2985512 RepID=UPI00226EBABD|nr:alpha/beta fold hydrolase [Niveibacterium sp. 24ML]MCX9156465.1 hypothetical protein [Niveibacterium sp. 24ML]
MQALFVHGMGRSPASWWPTLARFKRAGIAARTFGYAVTLEDFDSIVRRLTHRLEAIAAQGDYVVVGHSLGGVLLRAAINAMHRNVPRPAHLFLVGSPVRPSRLARHLAGNLLFQALARDCGNLLGSEARMAGIGPIPVPTTAIIGVAGLALMRAHFGNEPNDGVVSLGECEPHWPHEQVHLAVAHTVMPASRRVAELILDRIPTRSA